MKRHETLSVGRIIDMCFERAGNTDVYDAQRASYLWTEIVGPSINRMTTRRWVSGTELHVCIESASAKNDLSFLSSKIVERINNALGKEIITKLVIH